MKLAFVKPKLELTPYIESFWVFESPTGLPATESNMAAPNGCSKLTFAYGNWFASTANGRTMIRPPHKLNFVGNRADSIRLRSTIRPIGCIGIEFRPHGAFPIFGIPMEETFNFLGDADVVLGKWSRGIEEVLNDLRSVDQRVAFLQDQLVLRLRRNQFGTLFRKHDRNLDLVAYCASALRSTDGRIPIRDLELRSGYSRRHLDVLFKRYVGLSPKVLAGIFRFQRFYRKWAQGQSFDLLKNDLYEYFYDQSHFTKEFRKMTGHAPGEYCEKVSNEFGRLRSSR